MNDYFDIYLENPFKTYNKVKRWFKPINPKFQWYFGKRYKPIFLELKSFDVLWKDKFNEPRHEFNPRIKISLFNYIHLYVDFTTGDNMTDMVYWEAILDWIYYDKDLQEACTNHWQQYNNETKEYEYLSFELLKDKYQKKFDNKELKNWYYKLNNNDKN